MTTPSAPAENDLEAYEVAKVVRLTNPNHFVNGGASKPPAPRKRGVCKIALLAALLVLVVIGFGGGGFALGRATHPSCDDDDDDGYTITIDVEDERHRIEDVCTDEDFNGGDVDLTEACAELLTSEMSLYEALAHMRPAYAERMREHHDERRERRDHDRRRLGTNCDGDWTGTCCKNNRPGPLTGPSPICRVIMNSNSGKGYYECSWCEPSVRRREFGEFGQNRA